VSSGLTAGYPYEFRLRAKNIHGWGPYSTVLKVIPSTVPSLMPPVTTAVNNIYVKFSWTAPFSNGADITAYNIEILKSDGITFESTTSCDGSDPLIVS
jgi:hypothetical protein